MQFIKVVISSTLVVKKMKDRLSTWALNISPSPTLAVDAKAKALKAAGKDVCGFGAGEPDFDTPKFIKDACIKAIEQGKTKYIPAAGLLDLRTAMAQYYNDVKGLSDVKFSNIIVSPGGKFSCYLGILAAISADDEVIIPAPYWVSYPEMVKLAGGKPVFIHSGDECDFKVTAQQLEKVVTSKTKMLILTSPSNPTGAVYTKEELESLVDFAVKHDIFILSDEIYENLVYDGVKAVSPASISKEAQSRVIIASGFSKSYAMTGWRLGTLCAPDDIAKAVANLQSQTTSNSTTFAQYGALAAMQNPQLAKESLAMMLEAFDRRRLMLWEGLNSIKGVSCRRAKGAFYLFPNISSFGMSSSEFCTKLLEEELVAVVPGSAFGSEENIRFSYAVSDETIKKGLDRFAKFCSRL